MAERRADARCHREHRGDAGNDDDIECAKAFRSGLNFLAHRCRHGEHAGIAARHDRDARALRRVAQRGGSAAALLAIVGRMARLAAMNMSATRPSMPGSSSTPPICAAFARK